MVGRYPDITIFSDVSKNLRQKFQNLTNISREFIREGCTSHGRVFHNTFVLEHNKVLTVGFNDYRRTMGYNPELGNLKHFEDEKSPYRMCLHSEIDAILKMGKVDYSSISFFNVHLDKHLKERTSKPCPNCLFTLRQLGAKKIYYFDYECGDFRYIKL